MVCANVFQCADSKATSSKIKLEWFSSVKKETDMPIISPLLAVLAVSAVVSTAHAAPCMKITLTGTQGGPPVYQGQAGSGTLVQYGDSDNNCAAVNLQFDTGRGTTQRLSQAKTPVGKLNGIFLTHMHSDHTEGLADMMQLRCCLLYTSPSPRDRG